MPTDKERIATLEARLGAVEERLSGKNSWAQVLVMAMVTMVAAFGGVLLAKALALGN